MATMEFESFNCCYFIWKLLLCL